MREPERSEGQWRGKTFCLLLRRLSKVSRRKGGTRKKPWRTQWISPQIQKIKRSKDRSLRQLLQKPGLPESWWRMQPARQYSMPDVND